MIMVIVMGMFYVVIILWVIFFFWGILCGVNGGLICLLFIMGILFLLFLGVVIMGMVYGFSFGCYCLDNDVIEGLV